MNDTLKQKIQQSKVISFDMFDTLVIRIIDCPEILFDMMGKIFNIDNFRTVRTSMQAELGLKLQQESGYPHANIDEIYDYIKKKTKIKNTPFSSILLEKVIILASGRSSIIFLAISIFLG